MAAFIPEFIEALVKSLTDRVVMAVAGVSVLLIGISKLFPTSSVGQLGNAHVGWVYLIFLFCVLYLPTRYVLQGMDDWDATRKKHSRLQDLTKDEKETLNEYIGRNCRTVWFDHRDAIAKGLAEEGVLYCPDVPRRQAGEVAYNMHEWVRRYLKKCPTLLVIK